MSKSELKDAQKKRKRQEDGAVEVPKKSKKLKQSADADVESASVAVGTKEKKDKKAKKAKNQSSSEDATPAADDEPTSGTISGDERKKKKKDKKDKKEKKSSNAETDAAEDAPAVDSSPEKKDKKSKKDKKEKKSKKSKGDDDTAEPTPVDGAVEDLAAVSASEKTSKKDKKSKKEKKLKKDSDVPSEEGGPTSAANGADGQAEQAEAETNGAADVDQKEAGQNGRFIVFIGNLPFSTTKEQIEEHFAKLKPFEVRLRTYKDSGKSMGCGFIEFERFDHMQTALLKFHHSVIDDPKKKEGRKINVELSAGGGGNTEARVAKISAKNEKLANERQRNHEKRAEIEGKQQERKAKKEALKGKNGEVAGEAAAEEPETAGIHPARLAMLAQPERPQKQFKPNMGNVPKWKGGPPARGPKRY